MKHFFHGLYLRYKIRQPTYVFLIIFSSIAGALVTQDLQAYTTSARIYVRYVRDY